MVLMSCPPAPGAEPARDSAADAAYDDGWHTADNGGFGFLPWSIASNGGVWGIGSSATNGDTVAPAGDIDSAGRAWSIASGPGGTSVRVVRPLVGALAVGQTVSFDIDGICTKSNSDNLVVNLGNAGGARWNINIHQSGTHMDDGHGGILGVALDTFEGIHVDVTLTGPDSFTASARVLDGRDAVIAGGSLSGPAGSAIDQISFSVLPSFGHIDAFYLNNLAVTPEPAVAVVGLVGALAAMTRRRRRHHGFDGSADTPHSGHRSGVARRS